jgi:hypothetical protein
MRQQLELSRSVVAALEATPGCARLAELVADWDGTPSPLWRKRLGRHVRSCETCGGAARGMVPLERLLVCFALLPVPAALSAAILGKSALAAASLGAASAAVSGATGAGGLGVKAGLFGQLLQAMVAHPVAATVATGTLVAGAAVTTVTWPEPPPRPPAAVVAPTSAPAVVAPPPSPAVIPPPPRQQEPTVTEPPVTGPPASARPVASGPASLESVNQPGLVVAAADDRGVLERIDSDSDEAARRRATFEVVPGLADPKCVTLRAEDGRYLRHLYWEVRLSADQDTDLFRGDATFCVRSGPVAGSLSLESSNYPGWFLRHRGTELWVDQSDGSEAFHADTAFRARRPLLE